MLPLLIRRLAALWRGPAAPEVPPALPLPRRGSAPRIAPATSGGAPAIGTQPAGAPPAITPTLSFDLPPPRQPGATSRRYTWQQCYANLEMLWHHYGRRPTSYEVEFPPSRVGVIAYQVRFGTWSATIRAFEAYRAGDRSAWPMTNDKPGDLSAASPAVRAANALVHERLRRRFGAPPSIPKALRFDVLIRDGRRCTVCGADPRLDPTVRLHVDHEIPLSEGGQTILENLRTMCAACNLGKGARRE